MSELRIKRDKFVLIVRSNGRDGWDVSTTGGGGLTAAEVDQVAAHIGESDEAKRLIGKLRAKL